jgi:predicted regulator of Ras-like GTPase activity (Roadblock/LC7/MglB family)
MNEMLMQLPRDTMTLQFTPLLLDLQREHGGIIAAQVCTSDGFVVAQVQSSEEAGRRLAAMVSSMHALGVAMVDDLQLGTYNHLSVEASHGKCMLFALPGTDGALLLAVIADSDMLWGQLLTACRSLTEALSDIAGRANAA